MNNRTENGQDIFDPFARYGQDPIFEFANVPSRVRRFDMDIKLSIAQHWAAPSCLLIPCPSHW